MSCPQTPSTVIPAKAGIHVRQGLMDPGSSLRYGRDDDSYECAGLFPHHARSNFIEKPCIPLYRLAGFSRGSEIRRFEGRRRMLLWTIEFPGLGGPAAKRIPADLLLDPFISQFQSDTQGLGRLPM
jgi:hypothetical protein